MTSKRNAKRLIVFSWLLFVVMLPLSAQQRSRVGQTSTPLPDGGTLVTGGLDSTSSVTSSAVVVAADGTTQQLSVGMKFARAGHTATMLPDGTVFIYGGVGADGRIVSNAELYNPAMQTFSLMPDVVAVPRAFHTATLLTDGTVLLAGGVLAGGEFPDDVQLFDYRKNTALSQHAVLNFPREGHTAELLSDGTVRISGGTDHFGKRVMVSEVYDPVTMRFHIAAESTAQGIAAPEESVRIAASIPEDSASDVAIDASIAIRFTRLLAYRTVTGASFVLEGPNGATVNCTITPAENGRLVFVLPTAPLQPGTTYSLHIASVSDRSNNQLPDSFITFETAGEPPESNGPDWVPGPGWTTGTGGSKWQELSPLRAESGATALSGQILKLSGWPLQNVTLEMDGHKTHTDATGRFLLRGITPGHHVLWVDGSTANQGNLAFGTYEVGVTVLANKTNILNYTIWMTRLDMAHAINIPSPTRKETVLTNPALPGLELHIPANTTITDRNGKLVRQVTITPVPLDKPPFPLPTGVKVPIYFTVQPGGAYLNVGANKDGLNGARLFYPNGFDLKPGTPFDFWNYDADAKGWYIYGQGKVSSDGSGIIPDPGVVIYEFTGAMVGSASGAPGIGAPDGQHPKPAVAGDPVDLSTGQFIYTKTDLVLPDTLPISFTRTYITNDSRSRSFGLGATDSYDFFMVGDTFPYTYQELIKPDGGRVRFDRVSPGTSYTDAVYVAASSAGAFYGAVLSYNTDPSLPGWTMTTKDGTILSFPDSYLSTNPFCQAVIQIKDRYGNTTKIDRSACLLSKITSPNGRYITVTNDSQSRITQITDNSGRTVHYTYDAASRLSTVTDVGGGVTTYTYDDQNRMLTIQDPRGITYLSNQYDTFGRVLKQTNADGGTYQYNWTATLNSTQAHYFNEAVDMECRGNPLSRYDEACLEGYMPLVQQVDVTDPRGYVREVKFGPTGYMTSDTHALGQPEQQTVSYNYYSDNTLQSVTDALGRAASFDYDSLGNTTRVTRLDGTPNAVTSTFVYGGPFGQLSSATDPLGHSSTFSYDQNGNMTTVSDQLGHPTTFAYNTFGQVTSVTDALNNQVQFAYFGGDLAAVIDPLGNVSSQFTDSVGRVIQRTDAQGNTSQTQYNALNLVTQTTDANGGNTSFTYDPNGNLLTLTDGLNHATNWIYDNMDRPQTRTDPLLRQESYVYDLNGNLSSSTDRKGQVTSVTYDGLNRATLVGYNAVVNQGVTSYESTIGYTYDAGNRMTQAVDTAGGTITRIYDNLDRLITEATAQGSISYGYDIAGRRTSMTVAGQPQVSYSYDNGNRLIQITQGSSNLGFSYDNINRRSSLTLPNGVSVSYTFDNDSRVAGITYCLGVSTLGNLTYSYDSLGRRTQVGGSFARTNLPSAVSIATYDASNELTNWNGTAIGYDANGNMQSDGTNVFTWNARNQVASLNSVSLQYDAAGRRIRNGVGTSFLYDGPNAAQELSGTAPTANLWAGGVDELFQRADGNGQVSPLTDALGSVIGLTNASGAMVTTYAYDPFGNTTTAGAMSVNTSQYTGRENESSGLYFYRARYYSPVLGRFVNEDPLGLAGSGVNLYAYARNNPISFRDRFGLEADDDGPTPEQVAAAIADINATLAPLDDFYARQASSVAGRKDKNLGVRAPGQTFLGCLDANTYTYSIGYVFGIDENEHPGLGWVLGNDITSFAFSGPIAGGNEREFEALGGFYVWDMGPTATNLLVGYGATSGIVAEAAEYGSGIGEFKLAIDAGLALAEEAGCLLPR